VHRRDSLRSEKILQDHLFEKEKEGKIRIIADDANNALIIYADQENYRAIERVIKQLDILPLQVLIEASIIEITLRDELQYGLQWFIRNKLPQESNKLGLVGNEITLTDAVNFLLNNFPQGFSYAFLSKSKNIGAILRALAIDQKLNVLSSPSLMVLNNHEANIVVGDQISLRTGEIGSIQGQPTATLTTFQQRDTGVQLSIKPRVNAGGLVLMELEQRVDDVGEQIGNEPNPRILQRSIKTTVAVKDSDTLVLGGLIRDTRRQSRQGLPLLAKIPILGALFTSDARKTMDRTELVVLITPKVVENRRDAYRITDEYKRRLREIYQLEPKKQPTAGS
ncbi:MAG: secretin N-terminal domain-containing protein, partial [Methylohalobius sp.]